VVGLALVATLVQWSLHRAALLHTHLLSTGLVLGRAILLAAGLTK
jgi:hypothetical protein